MIRARFVPLDKWPEAARSRRIRGAFRASYDRRLALLERELRHLGGFNIVIQLFLHADQIRNDGWPRSGARPSAPGVIVSFQTRDGSMLSFPCDTYTVWEDNLYAIALGLESLRAVDRYGITRRAEQYQGWKRLASPEAERVLDRDWAIQHLASLAETTAGALRDPSMVELAYRAAARKTHPDHGGNTQAFQLLQDAMQLIRE